MCVCVCVCVCRHHILHPLRLRPPFPNDAKIDLRNLKMKNVTFNEQINIFLESKAKEALGMRTQA